MFCYATGGIMIICGIAMFANVASSMPTGGLYKTLTVLTLIGGGFLLGVA